MNLSRRDSSRKITLVTVVRGEQSVIVGMIYIIRRFLSNSYPLLQVATWLHWRHQPVDRAAEEVERNHTALAHPTVDMSDISTSLALCPWSRSKLAAEDDVVEHGFVVLLPPCQSLLLLDAWLAMNLIDRVDNREAKTQKKERSLVSKRRISHLTICT